MQNPIQTISRFRNFLNVFFFKISIFFMVSKPVLQRWEAWVQKKSIFSPLFYSAKSFSDHFTISEPFQCFFWKYQFFSRFRSLYCKGEKHEVRKKSFLVLFYSAKSNSDRVKISDFSSFFFENLIFFNVSAPILHTWETWGQQKITLVLFYSAKSSSDHFTISELFKLFFKKSIFFTVSIPILQS